MKKDIGNLCGSKGNKIIIIEVEAHNFMHKV